MSTAIVFALILVAGVIMIGLVVGGAGWSLLLTRGAAPAPNG